MYGYLNVLLCILLIGGIRCQKDDERDFPPERLNAGRTAKTTFDTQFTRGQCPDRFFQLGNECVYFSAEGKIYSWQQAERVCAKRVARMLDLSPNANQPNMQPTRGVRQLVLNAPEKTDILRAFFQEYSEQNYAIRLPSDYNMLRRCNDGQDDKWPHYCNSNVSPNATCFETVSTSPTDVCIREVDCNQRYIRLACEFTLPGSAELTNSKFRNCPAIRARRRRLPIWAWVLIAVGGAILVLLLLGTIIAVARKSKKGSPPKNRSFPEPRVTIEDKTVRVTATRSAPELEPMLVRTSQAATDDSGYLQPRATDRRQPPEPPTTGSATNA